MTLSLFLAALLPIAEKAALPLAQELLQWGLGVAQKAVREARDPTDAERAELHQRIDALRASLFEDPA